MPFSAVTRSLKSQICDRLKQARLMAGFMTAKEFAEKNALKISTYTLHEAGTRQMSLEVMAHYCSLLQIHMNWLLTGDGPKDPSLIRRVPIIQWQEVKDFSLYPQPRTAENWTTADIDLSIHSFALPVENDCMEPRYPEGTLIIVDCEQVPQDKEFAIILLKEKKIPVFKQIVTIEGELYARSINPAYNTLPLNNFSIILGKVVQAKLMC